MSGFAPEPWNRITNDGSIILHVGKERFPHEALCGKLLAEYKAKSARGKRKCENCKKSVEAAK